MRPLTERDLRHRS